MSVKSSGKFHSDGGSKLSVSRIVQFHTLQKVSKGKTCANKM